VGSKVCSRISEREKASRRMRRMRMAGKFMGKVSDETVA
jgi:hypothetical protein